MRRNQSTELPEEFYEIAHDMAQELLPLVQAEMEDLADEYDVPTALGIGGAALIYLICGLGNTYDDQMGQEPYEAAGNQLAIEVTEALNRRVQASLSRSNGELN